MIFPRCARCAVLRSKRTHPVHKRADERHTRAAPFLDCERGVAPPNDSGQAAVETALTAPLVTFLVLGTLQLFLLMQAKTMAQYAAYQAVRVGSMTNGRCDVMTHAALLSLVPALRPFMGPSISGTPGERLATAFRQFRDNDYGQYKDWSASEAVLWVIRESPRFPRDDLKKAREHFDNPLDAGDQPVRLELRIIFWAPLAVPFADWVITKAMLARWGLEPYVKQNPLLVTETAVWTAETGAMRLHRALGAEYVKRANAGHYVFPIEVTSTMRMMSPVQAADFAEANCPLTPGGL